LGIGVAVAAIVVKIIKKKRENPAIQRSTSCVFNNRNNNSHIVEWGIQHMQLYFFVCSW
jgi:hypothetical protein